MSVTPDETLLELIGRDLDGDLGREERQDLFRRLAEREDAHMLIRIAIEGNQAAAALRAACDAAPAPDLSGSILSALAAEAGRETPPSVRAQSKGLWTSLKGALGGSDRAPAGARGQGGLDLSDLAGVVAGTGAPTQPDEADVSSERNDSDQADTKDKEPG